MAFEDRFAQLPTELEFRTPAAGWAFIYKIENGTNKKIYVGRTTGALGVRWMGHKSDSKKTSIPAHLHGRGALYFDMRQVGLLSFEMSILEECRIYDMDIRELSYMKRFDTWNREKGYNFPRCGGDYDRKLRLLHEDRERRRLQYLAFGMQIDR